MKMNKLISEDERLAEERRKHTYICKCGHRIVIYPCYHETRKLCSFCGNYVHINKQEEFKYKMKGLIKNGRNIK